MLVLSRKQAESIFINDNVVVTVLRIRGDQVQLGIEAPREMPVHRSEVHERIQKRNTLRNVAQVRPIFCHDRDRRRQPPCR
jgi:carbon storage regulator